MPRPHARARREGMRLTHSSPNLRAVSLLSTFQRSVLPPTTPTLPTPPPILLLLRGPTHASHDSSLRVIFYIMLLKIYFGLPRLASHITVRHSDSSYK